MAMEGSSLQADGTVVQKYLGIICRFLDEKSVKMIANYQ